MDLKELMKKEKNLTYYGFFQKEAGEKDLFGETLDEGYKNTRESLLNNENKVKETIKWIKKNFRPIKSINHAYTSYSYKHIAEKELGYISSGTFIAAGILSGFNYKIEKSGLNFNPYACFPFSTRSIKETQVRQDLDPKIRASWGVVYTRIGKIIAKKIRLGLLN